jgi:hypothetical protein
MALLRRSWAVISPGHHSFTLDIHPGADLLVNHLKFPQQSRTVVAHLKVLHANGLQGLKQKPTRIKEMKDEIISKSSSHESTNERRIASPCQVFKSHRLRPNGISKVMRIIG